MSVESRRSFNVRLLAGLAVTLSAAAVYSGYTALQIVFGERKASRVTKPQIGHLAKAGIVAGELTQEFRVADDVAAE